MVGGEWYADRWVHWRWHKCATCGTVAIPHVTRWLDPAWYKVIVAMRLRQWWEDRRG